MVLPPRPEGPARPPALPGPNAREGPKEVYIRPADLERYGYTAGCRRCTLMRDGQPARGVRHTVACRSRVEAAMADAGDERLQQARDRQNQEIARRMEAADAARAPPPAPVAPLLPGVGPPGEGGDPGPGHDAPAALPEPLGVGGAEPAEEMRVEDDDDAFLMGALAAEGVTLRFDRQTAREANSIYEMLLVHGVSRGDAAAKVAELYSPSPRSRPHWAVFPTCPWLAGPPLT